ncbi:MAG: tail fiber protein [Alcanivoracaceae bacterium]|nr:tail fiber protein [Alcanivoracaceae bacterium]
MKKLKLATFGALACVSSLAGSPAMAAAEPLLGEIMWVGYNFCPRGWAAADGQILSISQNSALFSLYGTTYGGDGRSTFALPDLRGRVPMHTGRGAGLTERREGQKGGVEYVILTQSNLPAHTHGLSAAQVTLQANSNGGDSAKPENKMLADGQRAAIFADVPADAGKIVSLSGQSATVSGTSDVTGGGVSANTMSPYLVLRACVALVGIYPSRN